MDQQRQPVYGGGENLPHQQYDVDPQASFMSGDGVSFSDMFRSSSQESDSTQGQKISTHISTIPVQYGADPYMYTNPQTNWYGMPGMDPAHMYGYGQQFPGYEQGFPVHPLMTFYPENQIPCDNNGRSRSSSRKRSRSDRRSRSSSFGRKRGQDSQEGESRGRKFTGRSSSPYDRRRSSTSQNRSLDNPSESPNYRRRDSREGRRSKRSLSHSWSGSPSSFEDSKRQADISEKRSPDREKRRSWSSGRRNSCQDGRKQSVEEEGKIHEGGSSKQSMEKGKKVEKEDILSTSEKTNKDITKNKQSSKSKKKKESEDEKGKVKKKKKDGGENRKKSKKSLDSEYKLNDKNLLNEVDGTIKKSISDKGKKKVDSVPDQMSVVSSSSEKNKSNEDLSRQGYNDLEDVKVEDQMLHVTGDIRKIVHREKIQDFSDSTIIAQQKANKETCGKLRKGHSLLDQLTQSKWDSPDELYNSPFMKYSSPLSTQIQVSSKDPYERLIKKGASSSVDRNKRSNSREFEGIRIHITNDQYGKQTDKDNLGVVEMFHVNQQPRETNELKESVKNTSSTKSIESNKKVSDNAEKVETNSAKELPKQAIADKSRTYRKRVSSPPSKSKSDSPERVRSKHRWSRSKHSRSRSRPVHKRRSYSKSPLRRNSGVGSSRKMRPLMKGRNKFTGSRSRSISPGRKYSGRLRSRSRSPQLHASYKAHYDRDRERQSFRGSNYRGRGSFKSFGGYRKSFESYRPQRSRSRSRTRRSRSKSPRYKGQRQDQGHGRGDVQHKSESSTKSKQNNSSKIDNKTLDEIEDFYHQLKENKKIQKETEIQK